MDAFAVTRLAAGAGFLVVAAASDLRSRRVRDPLWVALGTVGLMIFATEIVFEAIPWPAWLLLVSAAIPFYAIFFGQPLFDEKGFQMRPLRTLLFLGAATSFLIAVGSLRAAASSDAIAQLASMPIMILIYQGFYRLRLLHGGADAKGLIALTLLIPSYPKATPFPIFRADPRVADLLRVLFPFSLVIWVNAAILSLAIPIGLLVYNAAHGDFAFPQSLLGYRARLNPFPAHAWLMEKITNRGEHVLVLFPKRRTDPVGDIARLRAAGIDRAWVTPQTPFMVPLLLGFLVAFFAGNVLVAILGLVG